MRLRFVLAALLLALGLSSGASATLLFAGGEKADFICPIGSSCDISTSSGNFRAAWARGAVIEWAGYAVVDPPANRFATAPFASSVLWTHGQYCNVYNAGCDGNGSSADLQMLRLMDSNGNAALMVRGTGTAGGVKISSRAANGTMSDLVTCPSAFGTKLTQLDLYVNYSSTGEVALYNNSVKVCDFSGDVTNGDGATALTSVEFSSASLAENGAWSEIIVATTDTRAMARFSANTVADGNTVGFSGTNICSSIWNAFDPSDSQYAYSGAPNVLHECTINSAIPPGSYSVLGLVMTARALVGATGPQHFAFATRVGGADYFSPDFAPLNSFSSLGNYIQAVNPATNAPWSVSDFQATGFNVGEKTKP